MVKERVGYKQRTPFRHGEAVRPVQLRPHDFIKKEVGALEVVRELEDVENAIVGPDQDRLGPAAQLSDKFRGN